MTAAADRATGSRAPAAGASPSARRSPPPQPASAPAVPSASVPLDPGMLTLLQRHVGNAAVSGLVGRATVQRSGTPAIDALVAGRLRFPGEQAAADMDAGLRELRRDEPSIDLVERGLKAAKAAGVPVDLEGVRPPASALAVTTTGFGPGSVAAKKPVPPAKKVPAVSPLGRAAAKRPPVGTARVGPAPTPATGGAPAGPSTAGPLGADALLQPPVPPAHVRPHDDPAFTAVTGQVKATAHQKRAHPPAAAKAREAQAAALPPSGDVGSQAKAAKADTMDAAQPGSFDKKAFIAAVKAAIEAKSPKTLKEADDYRESGRAGEVKGEVQGLVTQGKEGQTRDVEAATEAAPDTSKAVPKPVTPMGPEPLDAAVPVPAAGAAPKPAPAEQLNLAAGKHRADAELAEAEVDETQLAQSNEPDFQQALSDKKAAAAHADTAPAAYRQQETQVLAEGKADATQQTAAGVAGMHSSKGAALAALVADKGRAKTKDEARRAEVSTRIEGIFNATEAAVKQILESIDPLVEKEFTAGEAGARTAFEGYVTAKMSAYKKDRYGGWLGGMRWAKDKLFGMPDKVNEFYVAGRELYLQRMDTVISRVADIVGSKLTAAKQRIAAGRTEIAAYVKSLPRDLQKVGADASKEIGDRFAQLESDVDAKQEALVDTLASKYVEARQGLDARIEELQAENQGLVDKAIGAIKAVINTIRELAAMLRDVLARAAGVVGEIIKHPVAFLGNLIAGVKGGILKFKDNFLGHLRRGLMSWLFGALAEGGIELPKSFDLKGIIGLLASIFGLTWANIRSRIVKQIGEPAMGAVERGVHIFTVLAGPEGVGGLWEMLVEQLGNVKDMIFDAVKDFVQDRIITAGITWLIGLLNPAAAFIKACKLIYDVVMFFVNNASRIARFVNTVLDSMSDIVRGNIGGVVDKINDVLGQMVPIIIGFLASVIGLGGIGQKIREIVDKLQKPVNKAIDFVVRTGLKLAAPLIRGIAGVSGKVKAKVAAGKAWVKGKVDAGKAWVGDKAHAIKGRLSGTVRTPGGGPDGTGARSARPPSLDEPFTVGAQQHHIWTRAGGPLMVASSNPQPVSNLDRLKSLNDQYLRLPPTSTMAARKGVVDAMITLIKSDPTLVAALAGAHQVYDPPNLGDVGRHGGQTGRWMPKEGDPAFAPLWHLESEHVVPKAYLDKLFEAIDVRLQRRGLGMARITDAEYNSMTTVLIYRGAADIKTDAAGGDAQNILAMAELFDTEVGSLRRARNFSNDPEGDRAAFLERARALLERLEGAFDAHALPGGVTQRTVDAITTEWQRHAVLRGWPTLAASTARRDQVIAGVRQAHAAQLAQLRAFFHERLAAALTSSGARRRGR